MLGRARGRGSASKRRREDPSVEWTFRDSPALQVINAKTFKAEVISEIAHIYALSVMMRLKVELNARNLRRLYGTVFMVMVELSLAPVSCTEAPPA